MASKTGVQTLALCALWSVMPAQRSVSEKEVNACLNNEHLFQDPATLRRTMISNEMLARETDGSASQQAAKKRRHRMRWSLFKPLPNGEN